MSANLFILGCGRSGTSMLAGMFHRAGYFMGEHLHPARSSNPKGFFESPSINQLNEDILALNVPSRDDACLAGYGYDVPNTGHRWLSRIPPHYQVTANDDHMKRIRVLTSRVPFCYKDPRFCYTLPFWLEAAPEASCICIFRHPAAFIDSVFTECLSVGYLHNFAVSVEQLMETWEFMYRRVVDDYSAHGRWLFVQYEQLIDGVGVDKVARFAETEVDIDFPDRSLRRSQTTIELPKRIEGLHSRLQRLADGS